MNIWFYNGKFDSNNNILHKISESNQKLADKNYLE